MENIISLNKKQKLKDVNELYHNNYSFMLRMVDFDKNTIRDVERVYDGHEENHEIKSLISKEHVSIKWSLFFTLASVISVFYIFYNDSKSGFNIGLGFFSIFLVLLTSCLWRGYLSIENRKYSVICRVSNLLKEQTKLSFEEKGYLQEMISEEKMLELLWNKEDILVEEALIALEEHIYPFKDYKASQDLTYIKMVHNRGKIT